MALILLALLVSAAQAAKETSNPFLNPGLFEGDILGIPPDADRSAVPNNSQLWPNATIPYDLANYLRHYAGGLIAKAMNHIENYTCIKFVPKAREHEDYIYMRLGDGCNSHWGRRGGQQQLSLGFRCFAFSIVVHELLHAIGFMHEHNRPDRDDYLTIHYENIIPQWHFAFKKLAPSETRMITPFDYDSLLLYGEKAFSKDNNLKSIEAKDGRRLVEAQFKPGMSKGDIEKVNLLYGCKRKN